MDTTKSPEGYNLTKEYMSSQQTSSAVLVCECRSQQGRQCELCIQYGRTKIADSHCMHCCRYCANCGQRGHQMYNTDGTPQCFKLQTCELCGKSGHNEDRCRRHWCETCRYDGKGHQFIGHTSERCRKNQVCEQCGRKGHAIDRCRKCDVCSKFGHTSDRCFNAVCDTCGRRGHITENCEVCEKCGYRTTKGRNHRCKRNERLECKGCGATGSGRCPCWQYMT